MKCLNWNLEWKSPSTRAGRLIQDRIAAEDASVICYTETVKSMIPEGFVIEADPDYGYPNDGSRRKVMLWSREPWLEVDSFGDGEMPTGRFVSGITGGIRFVGVCIPWRDAHVRSGRKDRSAWEDHLSYCGGLKRVLARYSGDRTPICLVGDFNQRIPRASQPPQIAKALVDAIPANFTIATEGMTDEEGGCLIDHFVASPGLSISITKIVSRFAGDGTKLSDHPGILASLGANPP
jgi:exonuclease III